MYNDLEVAFKVLREYSNIELGKVTRVSHFRPSVSWPVCLSQPIQMFYKEVIVWKALHHPNVLPLLGVPKDRSQFKFAMVSEWMENGTINQFVKAQRDVNRFKLVSFRCVTRYAHHSDHATFAVGGRC